MGYALSDIKTDVRVILDRNKVTSNLEGLASDVDTLSLDDIIEECVIPAARQAELIAPKELVDWIDISDLGTAPSYVCSTNDKVFYQSLPVGYLRLGRVKLSCWKFGVDTFYTPDDKEYKRQWCGVNGLRATALNPLAAILRSQYSDSDDIVCDQLHLFGGVTSTSVTREYCTLAMEPKIVSSQLNIGDQLKQPFKYICASFVADALKDTERSNELMTIAKNLMTASSDSDVAAVDNNE